MLDHGELERGAIFAEEDFVVEAQIFLHQIMEKKGLTRADLARAMGVSRARVTQIFSDDCKNFTVRLLARAAHALGEVPELSCKVSDRDIRAESWATQLIHPEDIEAVWKIKEMFGEMRSWVPCNDQAPKCLTGLDYSELEWEAA